MSQRDPPRFEGLGADQHIIDERWPTWRNHMERWMRRHARWHVDLLSVDNLARLGQEINNLRQSITGSSQAVDDPRRYTAHVRGILEWEHDYLLPLARHLGIAEH